MNIIFNLNYILILISIFFVFSSSADGKSDLWDDVRFSKLDNNRKYQISSGTGFYVNNNYIITNKHVVEKCVNIAVRGDYTIAHNVVLHDSYSKEDLAILKTNIKPQSVPYFRKNISTIKVGDIIDTIGYPLDSGVSGVYVTKKSKVTAIISDNFSGLKKIEFTDKIDHGNSGGPILDVNSNIIGVVKEKVTYIKENGETLIFGRGLMLDSLFDYLDSLSIKYNTKYSFDFLQNYKSDFDARIYVVNIHCIKEESN